MNFLMAVVATLSMEWQSAVGWLWWAYYSLRYSRVLGDLMASLGPITVPAALEKYLPYAKFIVTLVGVAATVVIATVVGPPAWVYVVVAVCTALGVVGTPNAKKTSADAVTALKDAAATVTDVHGGDYAKAVTDIAVDEAAAAAVVSDVKTDVADMNTPPAV